MRGQIMSTGGARARFARRSVRAKSGGARASASSSSRSTGGNCAAVWVRWASSAALPLADAAWSGRWICDRSLAVTLASCSVAECNCSTLGTTGVYGCRMASPSPPATRNSRTRTVLMQASGSWAEYFIPGIWLLAAGLSIAPARRQAWGISTKIRQADTALPGAFLNGGTECLAAAQQAAEAVLVQLQQGCRCNDPDLGGESFPR